MKSILVLIVASFIGTPARSQSTVLLSQDIDESQNPYLVAFSGSIADGLVEVWRSDPGINGWRNHIDAPAIEDINGDGTNEIIAVDRGRILVWQPPSSTPDVFDADVETTFGFSSLTVGDLNEDGVREIIVGINNELVILNWNHGFNLVDQIRVSSLQNIRTLLAASRTGSNDSVLFVGGWSVSGDSTLTPRNQASKHIPVFDLLPNWKFENGQAQIEGYYLSQFPSVASPYSRINSLRLADLDGDKIPELVASGSDHGAENGEGKSFPSGGVAVWTYDIEQDRYDISSRLENQWRIIPEHERGESEYAPKYESIIGSIGNGIEAMNVADLTQDGIPEIITASFGSYMNPQNGEDSRISILKYERGEIVFLDQLVLPGGYSHFSGVAVGDLDEDGILEFTDSGKFLLNWDSQRLIFNYVPIPASQSNYLVFGKIRFK